MPRVGRNRTKESPRLPPGWMFGPRSKRTGRRAVYFRGTNEHDRKIVLAITGDANCLKLSDADDPAGMNTAAITYAEKIIRARGEAAPEAKPGTVAELCQRAREEFLPTVEHAKTRRDRERHVDELERLYGARKYARNVYEASRDTVGIYLRAMDVQQHVWSFKKKRGETSANRRLRTWEILFTWARAPWGLTEYNPCAGIMENKEKARRVVPRDPSIFKLYRELSPPARFMVGMIRYYGRRKIELLRLDLTDGKADGIHLTRGKDDEERPIIVKWDQRNVRMWARALRWREQVVHPTQVWRNGKKKPAPKVVDANALLLNSRGRRVTESGFNTERKRAMEAAGIKGEFTFHDMRKSRAEDNLTLAEAQNVLAHDDQRTTARVYRPNAAVVVDMNAEVAAKRKAKI